MNSFTLMVKHVDKRSFEVFLSVGTNIGNRRSNLSKVKEFIEANLGLIIKSSSIYETSSWGNDSLLPFYNLVLKINTLLNPQELLDACKRIEQEMGRTYTKKMGYENRVIDIDILTYEDRIINEGNLVIPHPFISERMFVLLPFSEINKNFQIAGLNETVENIAKRCNDKGFVRKLP